MAEEDNSQDKTEEPSQRKLDKAAEDGQVLTSKEMFVFTTLIMGLMVLTSIPFFAQEFLAIWKNFFVFDLNYIINVPPSSGLEKIIKYVIYITLIVGIPLIIAIFITQMAMGGINFAPKAFNFKLEGIILISKYLGSVTIQSNLKLFGSLCQRLLAFTVSLIHSNISFKLKIL